MIHPDTEVRFINDQIGYGVVAKAFIPKGTITWVLDVFDREFTQAQYLAMAGQYKAIIDTYAYRNCKGNLMLCWDNARFVNHSFNSNCLSTAYDFELAVRDIHIGEQLTDDYGYLNVDEPFDAMDEGTERKTVYPDDLLNYHQIWDEQLLQAIRHFSGVKQPLLPYLESKVLEKVLLIERGKCKMASILENYYAPVALSD